MKTVHTFCRETDSLQKSLFLISGSLSPRESLLRKTLNVVGLFEVNVRARVHSSQAFSLGRVYCVEHPHPLAIEVLHANPEH